MGDPTEIATAARHTHITQERPVHITAHRPHPPSRLLQGRALEDRQHTHSGRHTTREQTFTLGTSAFERLQGTEGRPSRRLCCTGHVRRMMGPGRAAVAPNPRIGWGVHGAGSTDQTLLTAKLGRTTSGELSIWRLRRATTAARDPGSRTRTTT